MGRRRLRRETAGVEGAEIRGSETATENPLWSNSSHDSILDLRYMANKKLHSPPEGAQAGDLIGRELSNAVVFFHEAIAAHLGISAAEWKCLGLLDQHGASTASRLAEFSGFTTGAITGIVDRLERKGYVRRQRHPTDRRSIIVQPLRLEKLHARILPIFQSLGRAMAGIASRYSQQELAAIGKFMSEMTATLRQETAKLRSSTPRWGGKRQSFRAGDVRLE
jgi:DNA-binding MarR family transcriptional regulator